MNQPIIQYATCSANQKPKQADSISELGYIQSYKRISMTLKLHYDGFAFVSFYGEPVNPYKQLSGPHHLRKLVQRPKATSEKQTFTVKPRWNKDTNEIDVCRE